MTLKERVAQTILEGGQTISFSNSSQSGTRSEVMPVAKLANQLTDVLIEKSLVSGTATTRMTFARFAR